MSIYLKAETTVYDRYAIGRRFTSNETSINVVQGSISALISESEIIELKNGDNTLYSKLANVEIATTAITAAISSSEYKTIDGVMEAVKINSAKISATPEQIKSVVTSSYVSNLGDIISMQSSITQLADNIELKVNKNGVIASINNSGESVTITAGKINFNGLVTANSNFKILSDGSMEAKNGKFTNGTLNVNDKFIVSSAGKMTATDVSITGGKVEISSSDSYQNIIYSKCTNSTEDTLRVRPGNMLCEDNRGYKAFLQSTGLTISMGINHCADINFSGILAQGRIGSNAHIGAGTYMQAPKYITTSSEELKTDIEPLNNAMKLIRDGDIYTYDLKKELTRGVQHKSIGLVIGEDYNVPEEIISDEVEGIDLYAMAATLWQGEKELDARSLEQQAEIEELKEKIKKLGG